MTSKSENRQAYPLLLPKVDRRSRLVIKEPFTIWPDGKGVSLTYNPNTPGNPKRYDEPTVVEFGFGEDGHEIFKTLEYPKGKTVHEEREPTPEELLALVRATYENSPRNPLLNKGLRRHALNKIYELQKDPDVPRERVIKLRNAYFDTSTARSTNGQELPAPSVVSEIKYVK